MLGRREWFNAGLKGWLFCGGPKLIGDQKQFGGNKELAAERAILIDN
jgi:hypothetical protein